MPPRSSWELRSSGTGKIATYYAAGSGNFTTTRRAHFLATSRCHPQIARKFLLAVRHKYHTPTFLMCTTHISKFFVTQVKVYWRILAIRYYARGRKFFPAKKLSIWFLAGKFFPTFLSPLPFLHPFPLLASTTASTSRRSCSSSCQMSLLLLILEPGGLERLNPGFLGRRLNPLDFVERLILILEVHDELWNQGILTENFLNPSSCRSRTAEPWIADCWAVVLSTRPRRSGWENNFGTSW